MKREIQRFAALLMTARAMLSEMGRLSPPGVAHGEELGRPYAHETINVRSLMMMQRN